MNLQKIRISDSVRKIRISDSVRKDNISSEVNNFIEKNTNKFDTDSAELFHKLMRSKFSLSFDELKDLDKREINKYKRHIIKKRSTCLGTKLEDNYNAELKSINKLLMFKDNLITEQQLVDDVNPKSTITISEKTKALIIDELNDSKYTI